MCPEVTSLPPASVVNIDKAVSGGEARRRICSLCSSSRSCAGMLRATLHTLAALMLSPRIHLKNSHGDRTCKSKLTRSSEGSITSLVRLQVKVSLRFLLFPIIHPGYGVQMCKFRATFVGKHAHVCFTRKRSRPVKSIPLNSLGRYLTHVNWHRIYTLTIDMHRPDTENLQTQ